MQSGTCAGTGACPVLGPFEVMAYFYKQSDKDPVSGTYRLTEEAGARGKASLTGRLFFFLSRLHTQHGAQCRV